MTDDEYYVKVRDYIDALQAAYKSADRWSCIWFGMTVLLLILYACK